MNDLIRRQDVIKEAKALGYKLIKDTPREKLLPCICGCNRREHWFTCAKGVKYVVLKCVRCEREASGQSEREAIHNWNEMIRGESDE